MADSNGNLIDIDPMAIRTRELKPGRFAGGEEGPLMLGIDPTMDVPVEIRHNVMVTSLEKLAAWGRASSLWPVAFGLACCANEMIAVGSARFDIARFGAEKFSASPRQADLMIVAGTVTTRMAPAVRRIYDQMAD